MLLLIWLVLEYFIAEGNGNGIVALQCRSLLQSISSPLTHPNGAIHAIC